MDDQQKTQQQTASQPASSNTSQGGPVSAPQSGSVSKEFEPRPAVPVQEAQMVPTEAAPELPQEVVEAGVEVQGEHPVLTPAHTQAGITHAPEILPHPTAPSSNVVLPMTGVAAATTLQKDKNVRHSVVWLASLILKHLKTEKKEV